MKNKLTFKLGFLSSVFVAILGVVYLSLISIYFATEGFTFPPSESVQLIAGIVTFLTAPGLLVVFSAIYFAKDWENKILASLGLSFIILYAAMISINRFVQLTIIQQSAPGIASQDLARFLPYSTTSIMFALEMLGWGFFSSLAAIFVAFLFNGSPLNTAIRWLFIAYFIFSFMGVLGFATETALSMGAFVAWGPILLALSILLAIYFQKEK